MKIKKKKGDTIKSFLMNPKTLWGIICIIVTLEALELFCDPKLVIEPYRLEHNGPLPDEVTNKIGIPKGSYQGHLICKIYKTGLLPALYINYDGWIRYGNNRHWPLKQYNQDKIPNMFFRRPIDLYINFFTLPNEMGEILDGNASLDISMTVSYRTIPFIKRIEYFNVYEYSHLASKETGQFSKRQ